MRREELEQNPHEPGEEALQSPGLSGGFNGSTQHPGRTLPALKTKAKSLTEVRTARALPWLDFDRVPSDRRVPPGKHRGISAMDSVADLLPRNLYQTKVNFSGVQNCERRRSMKRSRFSEEQIIGSEPRAMIKDHASELSTVSGAAR